MKKEYKWAEAILEATNGGLRIIKDYFPDADETKTNRHFKVRTDERTASASLKKYDNPYTWVVQDWGAWEKPKNAIAICMELEGLSFGEACKILSKRYNISYDGRTAEIKPKFSKRAAKKNEVSGTYINVKYKPKFARTELAIIGTAVTQEICDTYNFKPVASYEFVKGNDVFKFESTPEYPIFAFDFGTWQKIYQPKAAEKKNRFRYIGDKPKDFVFGLDVIEDRYNSIIKQEEAKDEGDKTRDVNKKLDHIIIASGDRDALNIASFGYNVIWFNSETVKMSSYFFNKVLKRKADTIYNLPDIDLTGVREARKLAFKFLELKTIWLPNYLKLRKDHRGNACKDFTDFVGNYYKAEKKTFGLFDKLFDNAMPMQFWDERIKDDKKKYYFNIAHSHHFLEHSGFARYNTPNEKDDYIYIRIDGNVIRTVTATDIKNYIVSFVKNRQLPIPLLNMVLKTPDIKEDKLSALPVKEIDFTDNSPNDQFWFFDKFTLQVTGKEIKTFKPGQVDKFIWEDKILQFYTGSDYKFIQEPHFKIFKDASGNWDIDILETKNEFLNMLINTSRIHWRTELDDAFKGRPEKEQVAYYEKHRFNIAGPNLSDDAIFEQKQHLINKIFSLGYMLHKHKDESRAWFVLGVDNKVASLAESHGGSGKSLTLKALDYVLPYKTPIDGRNKKLNFEFIYGGVNKFTDFVIVDDMHEYFDFQFFFPAITGDLNVNPKNLKGFTLKFSESPKFCGTMNFIPRNLDPSTLRRLLFYVNSDWYHYNKDGEYNETREIKDDFGHRLFSDWDENQWKTFYNFMAQALQFFLATAEKIEPPMNNVNRRNLISEMGDAFKEWADVYFSAEAGHLDEDFAREIAHTEFQRSTGSNMKTTRFKKAIKSYAKYEGLIFNPIDMRNDRGRIMKRLELNGKHKVWEMFHLQTPEARAKIAQLKDGITPEPSKPKDNELDDLPF